jgi:mycothiol synthase
VSSPIEEVPALSDRLQEELRALIRTSPAASDNPPISERGLLQLRAGRPVRHLIARTEPAIEDGDRPTGEDGDQPLAGYAQLDGAERPPTAELVAADPDTATALLAGLAEAVGAEGLRLWAHGTASAASEAALRAGLPPVRTLLQLRRSLTDLQLAEPGLPAGIRIRPFVTGQDEAAWLALNARAFAGHPEQGGWTERELADRMSSPWFDPNGFLLAERDTPDGPHLVGFHWTKVHPAESTAGDPTTSDTGTSKTAGGRVGEVYVLGIDPSAQGLRLGTALLDAGLRYLRGAGLDTVLLYVEESNGAAIHLYARAGFTIFASDIQYALSR